MMESYRTICIPQIRIIDGNTAWGITASSVKHLREDLALKNSKVNMVKAQYDVTKYELGDCNQSLLLNLICERCSCAYDAGIFTKTTVISEWIWNKRQKHFCFRILITGISLVVTTIFLVFLTASGDSYIFVPMWDIFLKEIESAYAEQYYLKTNLTAPPEVPLQEVLKSCDEQQVGYVGNGNVQVCTRDALTKLSEVCNYELSYTQLLSEIFITEDSYNNQWSAVIGDCLVYTCMVFILFDALQRLIFFARTVRDYGTRPLCTLLKCLCLRTVPCSRFARSLSVLSFSLFAIQKLIMDQYTATIQLMATNSSNSTLGELRKETQVVNTELNSIQYLTMIALGLRFVLLLHSLCLFPGIGHFIITIFRMVATLANFLVVMMCMLIPFAASFYFLMRNPECPSLRVEGYDTIENSLSSTFLLLVGVKSFPASTSQIAYLLYILCLFIGPIVLLNFIIAEMTKEVDRSSDEGHKTAASFTSHLIDSLDAESIFSTMYLPLLCWIHRRKLRQTGFIVEDNKTVDGQSLFSDDYNVYVMVHHNEESMENK